MLICSIFQKSSWLTRHAAEDEGEAYYLCGLLSSAPVAGCVKSYMTPTSISAHVLNKLYIPPYDRDDPLHREIARVCKAGHEAEDITPYAVQVDALAAELYARRRISRPLPSIPPAGSADAPPRTR